MIFSAQQAQKQIATVTCWLVFGLALLIPAEAQQKPESTTIDIKMRSTHSTADHPHQSMKTASALVMTHEEFETWWAQISNPSDKSIFVIEDGLIPVSLHEPISQAQSSGLEPMPKIQGTLQWVDYHLKIGDIISIQLLGHPELSRNNLLISPDGAVDLPLIGTIMVAGISLDEIRHELGRRFGYYLRYPNVTVTLDTVAPIRSYVIGAVKSPGVYLQDHPFLASSPNTALDYRLSALLAKSGGLLGNADLAHIKIYNIPKKHRREAKLLDLLTYGDMTQDILLEPEDVVYVPRLPEPQWNSPAVLKLLSNSTIGRKAKSEGSLPSSAKEQRHDP